MRYVQVEEIKSSVLGFGCGAVMGRVGRKQSLRAMEMAWDAGVTLFDTARIYGYGEAEGVLGDFLRGKRDRAVISTKFGILPQPQSSAKKLIKNIAKPIVRSALKLVPSARAAVRRGAASEFVPHQFTTEVLRSSFETSLRELKTNYVDLLFLHEAPWSVMQHDDLMAELESLQRAGKVRRVGTSSTAEVVGQVVAKGPAVIRACQFAANVFDMKAVPFAREADARNLFMVANHPFGGAQGVELTKIRLAEMSEDMALPVELREKLSTGGRDLLPEVVFGAVLRGTGIHAMVPSMLHEENLRANLAGVESTRFTDAEIATIRDRLTA